ncbi:MAG: alpha-ketoglutarate-dependent dioxygenase AlkB [Mucilaginibacter sp.]|uniref:alpha-ketoglutarate-dependent dioxygenase AlkB family protein n=1 Tax=Mucilaginibacter sp. TaxID=1882438 RepID=UPI003264E107
MEQLALFGDAGQSKGLPEEYLIYLPGLFSESESNRLLQKFIAETPWKQTSIKIYDKEVLSPRLTAWYGDVAPGSYLTEKITDANPWTNELLMIKAKVEPLAGMQFNSVLLNYYRDGNDSVAWHSDKGAVADKKMVVASVSFGQVRGFDIRNKQNHAEKYSVKLESGSFLLMKAGLQEYWEHRIAKSTRAMQPRVNLTFRLIV